MAKRLARALPNAWKWGLMKSVSIVCEKSKDHPYELMIQIDGDLPKAMNKVMRSHWGKNNSDQKRWKRLVGQPALIFKPDKPLSKFRILAIRYNYRLLDYDGLVASLKPIVDALKGIVIEDDRYTMTGPWFVSQEFRPKKSGSMLKIVITDKSLEKAS